MVLLIQLARYNCPHMIHYLMNVNGSHLWVIEINYIHIFYTEFLWNEWVKKPTIQLFKVTKIWHILFHRIWNFKNSLFIYFLISDTQTPDNSTWDVEERGQIIAKNSPLSKHVCGGNKLDAMYIDTRTVDEDVPWHEVNQLMTKNTPL